VGQPHLNANPVLLNDGARVSFAEAAQRLICV
jgi:hypothetical protein